MLDAPTPVLETKPIEFSSITDIQTKINISIIPSNSFLEFSAKIIDKTPQRNFSVKENESNLLKNAYLSTGRNIFGIMQILEYFINKKSYKIYEENKSIKIEINIEHPIIKFIYFTLLEDKKDLNAQVSELSSFVYESLANKIQSLEIKNNQLENKLKEIKNEYDNKFQNLKNVYEKKYQDFINKNEMKINSLEKMVNDLKNKNIETKIFNSKIEIDETLVKLWLNNRKFSANLLFRMSQDGDDAEIFHRKCDNKGKTLTFIETECGLRFGGYTELEWDKNSGNKKDDSTFIFSFNYKEKYTKRNDNYSIGCYPNEGPKFGWGPQIGFLNGKNLKKGSSLKSDDNSFVLNNRFSNGKEKWITKELEIYQINYL